MTQSDDRLWQSNSPTQQPDNHNNYVFRLRFDGDLYYSDNNGCASVKEFESYEYAVDYLKENISRVENFYVCQIEQYEVDLFTTDVFYTLDKNEYITKVGRYLQLESAQWELSSDEVVEKNKLRTYLNFNL